MNRGFTLIEILVVVSIVGMLSSVVVASVAPARARARDSQRIQQVRQIDLAIQLYKSNKGHAPDFEGSCAAQVSVINPSQVSGCIAVSTSAVGPNQTAWQSLKTELAPYISSIPNDPCGSNCVSSSGTVFGYTYYTPAALQYSSCNPSCGSSVSQLNDSYQISAQLEQQSNQTGSTYPAPNASLSVDPSYGPDGPVVLSWVATNSISCSFTVDEDSEPSAWDYYNGWVGPIPPLNFPVGSYTFSDVFPATFIFVCNGPGGSRTITYPFAGF